MYGGHHHHGRKALGAAMLPATGVGFDPVLYVSIGLALLVSGLLLVRYTMVVRPVGGGHARLAWSDPHLSAGRHARIRV